MSNSEFVQKEIHSKQLRDSLFESFMNMKPEVRASFLKKILKALPEQELPSFISAFHNRFGGPDASYSKAVKLGMDSVESCGDPIAPVLLDHLLAGGDLLRVLAVERLFPTLNAAIQIQLLKKLALVGPLDYPRANIRIHLDSLKELKTRCHSVRKEPHTVQWLETEIRDEDVLYDVGANVGAYSLVAAFQAKKNVQVFAFEPGFSNYFQLYRNVLLNDCSDRLFPFLAALSDITGTGTLCLRAPDTGLAESALEVSGRRGEGSIRQFVPTLKIDDLKTVFRIPEPTLCKIDVDGHEDLVLKGAINTFRQRSVRQVFVEMECPNGERAKSIDSLMLGLGFERRVLFSKGGNQQREDVLFYRK